MRWKVDPRLHMMNTFKIGKLSQYLLCVLADLLNTFIRPSETVQHIHIMEHIFITIDYMFF